MKEANDEIDGRLKQMRLIQRSILSKLQNKSSEALTGLQMLLKLTHEDIVRLTEQFKDLERKSEDIKVSLCCILNIIRETLKHSGLPNHVTESLQSVLVTPINDWIEQVKSLSFNEAYKFKKRVMWLNDHCGHLE